MLKHLDISNNLVKSISSGIFGSLEKLKIFLVYENNFIQLLFEIPNNINLHFIFVDHVLQCKYINVEYSILYKKNKYVSIQFSSYVPK